VLCCHSHTLMTQTGHPLLHRRGGKGGPYRAVCSRWEGDRLRLTPHPDAFGLGLTGVAHTKPSVCMWKNTMCVAAVGCIWGASACNHSRDGMCRLLAAGGGGVCDVTHAILLTMPTEGLVPHDWCCWQAGMMHRHGAAAAATSSLLATETASALTALHA
jgi:hypothetical protein